MQLAQIVRAAIARAGGLVAAEAGDGATDETTTARTVDAHGGATAAGGLIGRAAARIMQLRDDPLQVLLTVGAFGASVLSTNKVLFAVWALFSPVFFFFDFLFLYLEGQTL
jgi:hypothetical protein